MQASPRFLTGLLVVVLLAACSRDRSEPDAEEPAPRDIAGSPIDCDPPAPTDALLRSACAYYMEHPVGSHAIFVLGYACRTLVAGSVLLEEPRYLDAAIRWGDWLLAAQSPDGYWTTGYSKHYYLADTASALALLFVLHPHVDAERRRRYEAAITRHVEAIERDGLVRPSGAIGVGWRFDEENGERVLYPDEYTIASSLSGTQVFTWMYHHTGDARYLEIAHAALRWVLSTMRGDGVVPYVLAGEGADPTVVGDKENDRMLWEEWRYDTAGYVGEGIVAFLAHCDRPKWRRDVEARVAPIVEMLVRTQNDDGTWGAGGSGDQKRSPGVVNLLAWYQAHVRARPDVREAICRFVHHLEDRESAKSLGIQNAGAPVEHPNAIVTALAGRALAAVLRPGVDVAW